jgi:DNA (cytosine-5)-methyltransferase 1
VSNTHKDSAGFQSWYDKYGDDDFRRAISFNIIFLFKESIGIKDGLRKQPIWFEVLEKDYIPLQEVGEVETIVTPYVYEGSEHLRFGHLLKSVAPTRAAHDRRVCQGNAVHLAVDFAPSRPVVEIRALSKFKIGNGHLVRRVHDTVYFKINSAFYFVNTHLL